MSILSNINVGVNFRKEKNNLSQDTHTTAEIGYFQPTFCRYLVPRTHVNISAKSLVRLSPLAVPTMGRVSLRHYFSFIDLATLWAPFEAFRTGNNYTYADGITQIPYQVPSFSISEIIGRGFSKDLLSNQPKIMSLFYCTLYKNGTLVGNSSLASELTAALPNLGTNTLMRLPVYYKQHATNNTRITSISSSNTVSCSTSGLIPDGSYWIIVTNKTADFSFRVDVGSDSYMFLCKFTNFGKRVRKQFIGCGYSFNPFDDEPCSPLKLLAVYKSWYDKFAVQRTMNFNNTNCYKFIKYISETAPLSRQYTDIFDSMAYADAVGLSFISFIEDLGEICYVLPPDYFSASDTTMMRGATGVQSGGLLDGLELGSINQLAGGPAKTDVMKASTQTPAHTHNSGTTDVTGGMVQMALKAARYINKRSVVGRKLSELLKLEGESDLHNKAHESVHHMGSSKVDIQISDVMSLADTSSASLGDYAGRGIGFKDSDKFVYDTPCYGILLCLTAVVPTSGYFQGILKENTDLSRFDFFTEDYDALGYQSIAMNELVSDFQFQKSVGSNPLGTQLGYFGLCPRYQHLRIGRNICGGDISLPSMQPVMLPYNLDRHFITCSPSDSNNYDFNDVSVPNIYPETFRQVKADSGYGDYNRIFQYMANDFDHFIIHMVFDVPILSPMKSVANAYDTFQEDDNKAIEFKHE